MKKKIMLFGTVLCMIFTMVFMGLYIYSTHKVSSIDLNNVQVVNGDNIVFMIDNVNKEKKIYSIYGVARNENIKYKYSNWVNGDGENLYKNYSIVLVNKKDKNIYKLKTYIKSYVSSNSTINEYSSIGEGLVAYVPFKYAGNNYKIAILFEDREQNMYLYYPEDEVVL